MSATPEERFAIIDLMNRYALGVDRRDWPLYRSCFEESFAIDSAGWPKTMNADEWVEIIRRGIENYAATHHQMSNHSINIDGNRAQCIAYIRAVHHQPEVTGEPHWTLVGYYDLDLRRTQDTWKIARFNLIIQWDEGNPKLREMGPQPPPL